MKAHVRLLDVEEYVKPYTVTRKSDGTEFTLDPGFNCTVEVVDDNDDGSDDGAKFSRSSSTRRTLKDAGSTTPIPSSAC